MKVYAPNYYDRFACLMGDCRHSCCIGWEIDIDEESLARYNALPGDDGCRLRNNITHNESGACFRMLEDERCPFLNENGLCDMIIRWGDDILCQICSDHPRFRNFFSDREEIGLGLCCEAAAKLILESSEPAKLEILSDDCTEEPLYDDEAELILLRDELIEIIQDRSRPMPARIKQLIQAAMLPEDMDLSPAAWTGFLMELERLDESWPQLLARAETAPASSGKNDMPLEQLMVYLLMRHLPGALDDGDLAGRIAFCCLICTLLDAIWSTDPDPEFIVESARMYSSEIEYSDENIEAILDELHRLNPAL